MKQRHIAILCLGHLKKGTVAINWRK
jgi:hypothetical protein